jgi:hypothetical protein
MPLSRGSDRAAARPKAAPYYERLDAIEGGFELTHAGGQVIGSVRAYDDREDEETGIHVQFRNSRGKTSVFHFADEEEFQDFVEAIAAIQDAL